MIQKVDKLRPSTMPWMQMGILDTPTQEEWLDVWAQELIDAGYISKVLDQDIAGWELYEGDTIPYTEEKVLYAGTDREKIKKTTKKYILHRRVNYTPDRVIFWTAKSRNVFFTAIDDISTGIEPKYFLGQKAGEEYISVLDVKSPFGSKNSSDVSFSIKKKWVWVKFKVYVNQAVMYPIKPLKNVNRYLWPNTFTPERFLYTDKLATSKNKPIPYRTIPNKKGVPNWDVVSLKGFLK